MARSSTPFVRCVHFGDEEISVEYRMRKTVVAFVMLLLSGQQIILLATVNMQATANNVAQAQTANAALDNKDVLEMLKAGLAQEIVIAKIKTSVCKFDSSPAALQELKTAGVPDAVILAMVKASSSLSVNNGLTDVVPTLKRIEVKLPAGTPVEIETANSISSADVENGSLLSFRVVSPVKVNGITLVENGALVTGRIVKAKRSGSFGRGGKLAWSVQDVVAADGKLISLQFASGAAKGESRAGEVAARTVASGVALAPLVFFAPFLAPMILLHGVGRKGENAVLAAGRRFEVFVQKDALISAFAINATAASNPR